MVQNDFTRPALATIQQQPSSKMPSRNSLGKKTSFDSRRGLFSRMYGGGKAAVQAKVAEVIGEESSYDYNDIPVDADGLPLTSSDLHNAVKTARDGDESSTSSLSEEEQKEQKDQAHALSLFHQAVQVISSLPFQYEQSPHLYSTHTQDMGNIHLREGAGPESLEELMALRLAMTNLSAAFIYADPSGKGRQARKSTSTAPAKAQYKIAKLHRKPVPDSDEVDSIRAPSTVSHNHDEEVALEQREELVTYDSTPVPLRAPKVRGVYQARALRKLQVERISSGESSSEEENNIAHYYISRHRASRKNEVKLMPRNAKRTKAVRRTTSILDSKDELQSYLLKSGATSNYQSRSKDDFINSLDEAHRRTTAPPVPCISSHFSSSGQDNVSSSSEGGNSPQLVTSTAALSSDFTLEESPSSAPTSDISCNTSIYSTSFSTSPSSRTSSVFFSSDEDRSSPKVNKATPLPKRSYSEFQPARPKRHPARGRSTSKMEPKQYTTNFSRLPSPKIPDDSNGLVIQYSQLESSSDVTPRPGALGFDTGFYSRVEQQE